jgi:hypothetical protein
VLEAFPPGERPFVARLLWHHRLSGGTIVQGARAMADTSDLF